MIQAIKYHKQELTISKEVNDRASEAATHGNLAVAYQALNMHDMALTHYHSHLNIARELKDTAGKFVKHNPALLVSRWPLSKDFNKKNY